MGISRSWFVLYCRPHAEQKVCERLLDKGVDAYRPTGVRERRHRNSHLVREITISLFPRYLFVYRPLLDDPMWFVIRNIEGIESALYLNGRLALVPDHVIDDLKRAQALGSFDERLPNLRKTFAKGERVRIMDGAFAGHLAVIQSVIPGQSAKVLMELFGGIRRARVTLDTIQPCA